MALSVILCPLSIILYCRRSPPPGTHTGWASYPQVTLTPFAHPRLSIIGPLRGPLQPKAKQTFAEVSND